MYTKTRRSATASMRESLIGRQRADLRAPDLREFPMSSSSPSAIQKVEPLRALPSESSGDQRLVAGHAQVDERERQVEFPRLIPGNPKVLQHVLDDEARLKIAADHPRRKD